MQPDQLEVEPPDLSDEAIAVVDAHRAALIEGQRAAAERRERDEHRAEWARRRAVARDWADTLTRITRTAAATLVAVVLALRL